MYSQRYSNCRICFDKQPIALKFDNRQTQNFSDDDFIKNAIDFSKAERIDLDILEDENRVSADFHVNSVYVSGKSVELWEKLMASASFFEVVITEDILTSVLLRFGKQKQKK